MFCYARVATLYTIEYTYIFVVSYPNKYSNSTRIHADAYWRVNVDYVSIFRVSCMMIVIDSDFTEIYSQGSN